MGDEDAFEVLFHRYYADLCGFATRYAGSFDGAREVVQTVFIRLWENRERWRIQTSVRSYLFAAVRNQGLNFCRDETRIRHVPLEMSRGSLDVSVRTPEDYVCLQEHAMIIQKAIDQLPERQRTAFLLHRRHDLTYREIASIMDISLRTVEVHIARALKKLYLQFRD